jgi:hypothetical protein
MSGQTGDLIPPSDIIWDFDLSYDSNGDGNAGNDNDLNAADNDSFSVEGSTPPKVLYKEYKNYKVKLTAKDGTKSDTTIRDVNVKPIMTPLPPIPLFSYSKDGSLVTFKNKSMDGYGNKLKVTSACNESLALEFVAHQCYKYEWFVDYNPEPGSTNVSYKTLQNIVAQREGHKVKEWDFFISEVLSNIKHPEFLRK